MREFSSSSRPLCLPIFKYAFVTSRYDVFAINLATVMLGYVYGHTTSWSITWNAKVTI